MAFNLLISSKYLNSTNVIVNVWSEQTDAIPDKVMKLCLGSIKRKISKQLQEKKISGFFRQSVSATLKIKEVQVHWIIK
jgi:hypothetical protein